jgi:hypothetical protein
VDVEIKFVDPPQTARHRRCDKSHILVWVIKSGERHLGMICQKKILYIGVVPEEFRSRQALAAAG